MESAGKWPTIALGGGGGGWALLELTDALVSWCVHVKFFSFDLVCPLFLANVFVELDFDAVLK